MHRTPILGFDRPGLFHHLHDSQGSAAGSVNLNMEAYAMHVRRKCTLMTSQFLIRLHISYAVLVRPAI